MLRDNCIRLRRAYTRMRKRRRNSMELIERIRTELRDAQRALRKSIMVAKKAAWQELQQTIDRNPWGIPYKVVLSILRTTGPPITEVLSMNKILDIVSTLFPTRKEERDTRNAQGHSLRRHNKRTTTTPFPEGEGGGVLNTRERIPWRMEYNIGMDELRSAVRRIAGKRTAPGPDGLPCRIWAKIAAIAPTAILWCFNTCLREGKFPTMWKRGRLVLVPKPGSSGSDPSAFRPLCLLDDLGKLLERILVGRIEAHLDDNGGISSRQFGFRPMKSTCDAIKDMQKTIEEHLARNRACVAVSLDIQNAFNTLSWRTALSALRKKGFPRYLMSVLEDYFQDRFVVIPCNDGKIRPHRVTCGVPQGCVLGPLLWDIAYDEVLDTQLPPLCTAIGYADDTLVLAAAAEDYDAASKATLAVALISNKNTTMGLKLAPQKTDAIVFRPRGKTGRQLSIRIDKTRITTSPNFKYLGLIIDDKSTFKEHFKYTAQKTMKVASALARLLPNVGGPNEHTRRLYSAVVHSIMMYGAPI